MRDLGWIWFDIDGTFVDFYGVEGWLDYLMKKDATPYRIAKPIYDMVDFIEILADLKEVGYKIGVISWLAKTPNVGFDRKVIKAKMNWLESSCVADFLDEVIITSYGMRKADSCREYGCGILIDDEEQNRKAWDLGDTINATENILDILKKIVDNRR